MISAFRRYTFHSIPKRYKENSLSCCNLILIKKVRRRRKHSGIITICRLIGWVIVKRLWWNFISFQFYFFSNWEIESNTTVDGNYGYINVCVWWKWIQKLNWELFWFWNCKSFNLDSVWNLDNSLSLESEYGVYCCIVS